MPPSAGRRRIADVATALLLVASLLAVPAAVDARGPPRPACGVCTDALEDAAADRDVAVERADSELTVRVAENGSSRWTARVTLSEGAAALENDSLREAVVADARHRAVTDPESVTSRMEGDTLVVSYRTDAATRCEAGVVLFTAFRATGPSMPFAMGGEGPAYLGAEELTLRGPDDRVAAGEYPEANASGGRIRWTGSETSFGGSAVVPFVPEDAAFPGVRAGVARLLLRF
ncbi:hypothetical protein [Halorarum halobium]|uniref:hypothetical protein n=1 Tax=Halorarum halobium TaxID=3075121 RepID=UPI0028A59A2E|nr:hypothetical protein [Halobaculum sp. XH14]